MLLGDAGLDSFGKQNVGIDCTAIGSSLAEIGELLVLEGFAGGAVGTPELLVLLSGLSIWGFQFGVHYGHPVWQRLFGVT